MKANQRLRRSHSDSSTNSAEIRGLIPFWHARPFLPIRGTNWLLNGREMIYRQRMKKGNEKTADKRKLSYLTPALRSEAFDGALRDETCARPAPAACAPFSRRPPGRRRDSPGNGSKKPGRTSRRCSG